jgi:hypothetical protein
MTAAFRAGGVRGSFMRTAIECLALCCIGGLGAGALKNPSVFRPQTWRADFLDAVEKLRLNADFWRSVFADASHAGIRDDGDSG